jgi:predicted ribosomally synthesized peptide with nif11-like leader
MSKENIAKFQEAVTKKPELLEKLKGAHTPEAIVAVALAEGFDFTAKELQESGSAAVHTGKLSDEALEDISGGDRYYDGYIDTVTIGYGCDKWEKETEGYWFAVAGQCGSCVQYEDAGFGFVGKCSLRSNSTI